MKNFETMLNMREPQYPMQIAEQVIQEMKGMIHKRNLSESIRAEYDNCTSESSHLSGFGRDDACIKTC